LNIQSLNKHHLQNKNHIAMSYFNAIDVISPKRNLRNVVPIQLYPNKLYPNKDFTVAKVVWDGIERIAIRWNVTENESKHPDKASGKTKCIGEPNSRGYPTWFIVPEEFLRLLINGSELAENIKNILSGIPIILDDDI
jgi:hypothetical protein